MKKKSTIKTAVEDVPITQDDIDAGRLLLRRREGGRVVQPKKRVTLYLDAEVVDHFRQMAGERGYQTLINEALMTSLKQADLEQTLRRIIREEMRQRKVA